MNFVYLVSDRDSEFNSSRWRCSHFVDALQRAGHHCHILSVNEWMNQTRDVIYACSRADVIVIQRVLVDKSIEHATKWRRQGKTVVVDWDDGYKQVDDSNPAYEFWQRGLVEISAGKTSYKKALDEHPLVQFEKGMRYCSAGTVPSRVIVNDYSQHQNVYWLPNYIDPRRYLEAPKWNNGDSIVIGYGGSLGHLPSIQKSGVAQALQRITRERNNVYIFIVGDKRLADALSVRRDRVQFSNYVTYDRWPRKFKQFDISIAPLWGPFDMRRSFLKALEAATCGVPMIGTWDKDYPVYDEFVDYQSQIYVPSEKVVQEQDKRAISWYEALSIMIDNIDDYKKMAQEDTERAEKWNIFNNVENIIDVYQKCSYYSRPI